MEIINTFKQSIKHTLLKCMKKYIYHVPVLGPTSKFN